MMPSARIDVPTSGRPLTSHTDNAAYHDWEWRLRRRRRMRTISIALQYLIFISAISGPAQSHFKAAEAAAAVLVTSGNIQGSVEVPGTFNGTQAIIISTGSAGDAAAARSVEAGEGLTRNVGWKDEMQLSAKQSTTIPITTRTEGEPSSSVPSLPLTTKSRAWSDEGKDEKFDIQQDISLKIRSHLPPPKDTGEALQRKQGEESIFKWREPNESPIEESIFRGLSLFEIQQLFLLFNGQSGSDAVERIKSGFDASEDWRVLPISSDSPVSEFSHFSDIVHYFHQRMQKIHSPMSHSDGNVWEEKLTSRKQIHRSEADNTYTTTSTAPRFVLWCPWHEVIIVGCTNVKNKWASGADIDPGDPAGPHTAPVNTPLRCAQIVAAGSEEASEEKEEEEEEKPEVHGTRSNLGLGQEAVKLLASLSAAPEQGSNNICGISTNVLLTHQSDEVLPGRGRRRHRRQSKDNQSDVNVIPSGQSARDKTEVEEIQDNEKSRSTSGSVGLSDIFVGRLYAADSGEVREDILGNASDVLNFPVDVTRAPLESEKFHGNGGGVEEGVENELPTPTAAILTTTSASFTSHRINRVFESARGRGMKPSSVTFGGLPNYPMKAGDEERYTAHSPLEGSRKVSVLGLFELSTRTGMRPEGHSELAAAQMAIKHINDRSLLPGYTLELLTNDTECDPGVGVDRFFHALYTQHSTRMVMLLGSACSEVTESLAKVVPYWNIVQVSFGSTSPALSDRQEFPLFYRTVAPDSSHNPARITFIRHFGWDTVTTFTQNEEVHSLAVNDLVTELESANIKCGATITFAETDFKEQLLMLRDLDTRIIIGSFSHELAPKIFCEAYKLGMYGADYAWILHETMGPPWWQQSLAECSQWELEQAVENLIIVSSHNSIVGGESSISGLTNDMFRTELHAMAVAQPMSPYAPQTYDAVWAMALALKGAEERWRNGHAIPIASAEENHVKLDRFDYTRHDMAAEFLRQFSQLSFMGISGPVSFEGPDRVGTSVFHQIQGSVLRPIALYIPERQHLDFVCRECRKIKWKSGQVPIAKRVFKFRYSTIAPTAFYTMTSLACVGIALTLTFLAFNLHFRKLKTIKLSSPKLSNITLVGCIFVYAAVILLGLDHSTLPASQSAFSTVCTARVYLLSAGFSLAFGSMFAKTYRVHRIFTHSGGGAVCKDKMLQDTQLISLVCALLLLDGLVVTLWVVADPMERHLNNLSLEISAIDRSVAYQPQVEVCRSQHTQSWLGALYVYKGLLLIVGVYMAWETRHVKIPALNDSQYIGVSVYLVVITSAIVVVLANLISERVTLAFITITALILTSTTATLCLLFLPKLHDIWHKLPDPVIHTMGLKMECNTRRFVTDDRRELQYRVEVQNRVYKKEVAALDAEILKLEKQLEQPLSSTSSTLDLGRHIKTELTFVNEHNHNNHHHLHSHTGSCSSNMNKGRTPSIGGGLPLLLLSVLPPVIPRASWPSADPTQAPMRRSVTFSSQPHLDEPCGSTTVRLPAIDLLNLRLTHQQATAERSLLNKLRALFMSSRQASRKQSTTSIAGSGGGASGAAGGGLATNTGIAAALKAHMGLLSGLVPSGGGGTASCNALNIGTAVKGTGLRRMSLAKSGTAINSSTVEIVESSLFVRQRHRKISTALMLSAANSLFGGGGGLTAEQAEDDGEETTLGGGGGALKKNGAEGGLNGAEEVPRVNFQLPANRRPSICHQTSQPTLRERVKGSPRFPHRIMPTSSLNALAERDGSSPNLDEPDRRRLAQTQMSSKWKSMEESTFHQQAFQQMRHHQHPNLFTEPPPKVGEEEHEEGTVLTTACVAVMSNGNQGACEESRLVASKVHRQPHLVTNGNEDELRVEEKEEAVHDNLEGVGAGRGEGEEGISVTGEVKGEEQQANRSWTSGGCGAEFAPCEGPRQASKLLNVVNLVVAEEEEDKDDDGEERGDDEGVGGGEKQ